MIFFQRKVVNARFCYQLNSSLLTCIIKYARQMVSFETDDLVAAFKVFLGFRKSFSLKICVLGIRHEQTLFLKLFENSKSFHDHLRRRPKTDTASESTGIKILSRLNDSSVEVHFSGHKGSSKAADSST